MNIAFFVYPSAFQAPGGGEIFLIKTKEALEAKGVSVKLFNQWEDKLRDFDILHVFGSVKECLGLMRTAKSLGVKIVLTPIFWSTFQRSWHEYGSLNKKALMILRHCAKVIFPVMPSARREMMLLSDVLAANSEAEARQVSRMFAIDKERIDFVYLAADRRFAEADKSEFVEGYGMEGFVLSVGRIEPRKNQLNLIRAMKGSGRKLVFLGSPVPGYEDYYKACVNEADEDTHFFGHVYHESALLSSAYAACGVFVLQSWLETPGLVALEAGLAGARLAVTTGGSTREYFKDYVEYLDPASTKSIRMAIERAFDGEKDFALKEHIMSNFLWSNTAERTIDIYKRIIGTMA